MNNMNRITTINRRLDGYFPAEITDTIIDLLSENILKFQMINTDEYIFRYKDFVNIKIQIFLERSDRKKLIDFINNMKNNNHAKLIIEDNAFTMSKHEFCYNPKTCIYTHIKNGSVYDEGDVSDVSDVSDLSNSSDITEVAYTSQMLKFEANLTNSSRKILCNDLKDFYKYNKFINKKNLVIYDKEYIEKEIENTSDKGLKRKLPNKLTELNNKLNILEEFERKHIKIAKFSIPEI